MGAVLRGRDVDLGCDLAVKVLLASHADRPEVETVQLLPQMGPGPLREAEKAPEKNSGVAVDGAA
jgi:hypothetical protein